MSVRLCGIYSANNNDHGARKWLIYIMSNKLYYAYVSGIPLLPTTECNKRICTTNQEPTNTRHAEIYTKLSLHKYLETIHKIKLIGSKSTH